MNTASLNGLWAHALISGLAAGGVEHAVICPGSRSSPLAIAAAESRLRCWSIIDERSAGFFALGLAKATRAPAILIATSGTAGAHFLPAVIEASLTHVPLIVLTADRPWELQGWGAAQTIPQARLFGEFAKYFELSTPDPAPDALKHVSAIAAQAGSWSPRGPVQINVPFREPLVGGSLPARERTQGVRIHPRSAAPDPSALRAIAERIGSVERGVIVAGPRDPTEGFDSALAQLAIATGYPILAEATSGVRFGRASELCVSHYDALLRSDAFRNQHLPELVLRFGGGLTPKSLMQYVDRAEVVSFSDDGMLTDPSHAASHVVIGDAVESARQLAAQTKRAPTSWARSFFAAESIARRTLELTQFSEPAIARELVAQLPPGSQLVLASSMPIRDVDAFASASPKELRVFSNRGANGIDGTISTALGVAAATGRQTTLLIGDVAFLHDVGALLTAHRSRVPLTIVVVNNDGGGIFNFLPVAQATPHFEALWGTAHGLHFEQLAAQFGAAYSKVTALEELRAAIQPGFQIVECVVPSRAENVNLHRALFEKVAAALGDGPWS